MINNNEIRRRTRFRRVMVQKIVDRSVNAPSLLSANTEILRLAQQMRTGGEEQQQAPGLSEVITVY